MASDYWSSVQSKSASAREFMDHFAALLAVVYIGAQSPYTIPGGSELTCRFGHASAGADVQFVAVWWLPIPCVAVPRAVLCPGDASELNGYWAEICQGDRGGLPAAAGCGQEVSIDFVVLYTAGVRPSLLLERPRGRCG